jgi:hypothetical protein
MHRAQAGLHQRCFLCGLDVARQQGHHAWDIDEDIGGSSDSDGLGAF